MRDSVETVMQAEYSFLVPSTQTRVLLGERQTGKTSAYNIVHAWSLTDQLDPLILEVAINDVIRRHDLLRGVFAQCDKGFECNVLKTALIKLERKVGSSTQEEVKRFAAAPFLLTDAPALRLGLFDRVEGGQLLVLSIHHVIADDVSVGVLCADLCSAYERNRFSVENPSAPLNGHFADLVEAEHAFAKTKVYHDQLARLLATVKDHLPSTFMPRALPQNLREPEDGFRRQVVPEQLAQRIEDFCHKSKSTPFIFFASVFGALAARYSGEGESLFAMITGNRLSLPLRRVCGNFINTIPVRLSIDGEGFDTFFPKARTQLLRAMECHRVPYNDVLREQATKGAAILPLRIAFLEKLPTPALSFGGVLAKPEPLWVGATKLDLTTYLVRTSGTIELCVEYSNAYYTEVSVQAFINAFMSLSQSCLDHPTVPLAGLPLIDFDNAKQAIAQSFGPKFEFTDAPVTNDILHHCEQSADRIAASEAGSDGIRRELTYRELGKSSLAVMTRIIAAGIKSNSPVGVYMLRGIELTTAVLGVLRAGCIYMPLDPDTPELRLQKQAEIVSAVLVSPGTKLPAAFAASTVLTVDLNAKAEVAGLIDLASSNGNAYLIYTSGTTGTPNGVVNTHRALRNRLDWMGRAYPINSSDVILHKTPISFDVSVWELIWPLMNGARVHHARPGGHKDALYLDDLIVSEGITVLHFVPSMLRHFLENTLPRTRGSVRHLICSGESLTSDIADWWLERFGGRVHNLYGPTEAAIDVTAFDYEKDEGDAMLPIGFPIQNTGILILDQSFTPVPTGAIGNLYIAGENLADGYFGNADLTDRKFIWQEFGQGCKLRLYVSGDLARRRTDGAILFEGRLDSQVKLNGVRIELEDIEASLRAYPDIVDAVVVLQFDGGAYLSVFYRSRNSDLDVAAMNDWLLQRLPQSHIPSAYKRVDQFPTTPSGKLNRNAFPTLARGDVKRQRPFIPPRSGIETAIAKVWENVLELQSIGIDDNFYTLGGDSLRSLRCVAQLKKLGLVIETVEFLKNPTVRALAGVVRLSLEAFGNGDSAKPAASKYPAPSLVHALWVGSEIRADYRSYVTSYRIRGLLDLNALQRAVDEVVQRHPILRSAVNADSHGRALIVIVDDARVIVEHENFEPDNPVAAIETLTQWLDTATRHRWQWNKAPLLRCVVHRLGGESFQMTLIEPWLDGWSVQTLALELFDVYVELITNDRLPERPALLDSFANLATAEEAVLTDPAHLDFWRQTLAKTPETRILSESRDARQFRFAVDLGRSAKKLKTLASQHAVPLKSLLMGVHCSVVSVLCGARKLTTGVMFNGRFERAGGERTIGCYLNALPLTVDSSGIDWVQLARQCLDREIEITPWRRFPLDSLKRQFGSNTFDTLFNYTDFSILKQAPSTPLFELVDRVGFDQTYMALTAQFGHDLQRQDVTLYLEVTEPVRNRFGEKQLAGLYAAAFEACCITPEQSVETWRRQVVAVQRGLSSIQVSAPEDSLIALFNVHAENAPNQIILTGPNESIVTFGELRNRASEISAGLRHSGIGAGDIVAVQLQRSPDFVASILAVLSVGAVFLPLSLDAPPARHRFMCEDSHARAVIVDAHRSPPDYTLADEIWTVEDLCAKGAGTTIIPDGITGPEDGAHILYTSGSTGRPKGVLTSHRVVQNRLHWMWRNFPFEVGEVLAQKTTFAFVDSIWELFGGLLAGVKTHLFPESVVRDPIACAGEIKRYSCTRLTLTPTFAEALLRDCPDISEQLASIRVLVLSGEPLKAGLAMRLAKSFPNAKVLNLYGSTETGGDASCFIFNTPSAAWPVVPLGSPIDNCHLDVVDSNGLPAYAGVVGEILVSGACVCSGYVGWAREEAPKLTEAFSFPTWRTGDLGYVDCEGCLHYIGRADRQVKVRGVRIHLAEIEEVIRGNPGITESICAIDSNGLLVLFFQSNQKSFLPDVRVWLTARLPLSHLPSRVVRVDHIPKTLSGKVDHAALFEMEKKFRADFSDREPTDTEKGVMEAIFHILGDLQLTPSTDFFAIGGDSLAAATLVRRLSSNFDVVIPVRAVFETPVVAELAARIDHQRLIGQPGASVPCAES
jgi:amino acid adenylation domain-containing protein